MPRQRLPQRGERAQSAQHTQPARAQISGHADQRRALGADVGALERVVHPLGLRAELNKTARFVRAGKLADGLGRARCIGEKIEPGVATPGVACQYAQRLQTQLLGERRARRLEDLLEHPAHREHRGARVDRCAVHQHLAHLAAGRFGAFDQRDLQPAARQHQRADQPGHPGADHHHAVRAQGLSHRRAPATRPERRKARSARTWTRKNSCSAWPP